MSMSEVPFPLLFSEHSVPGEGLCAVRTPHVAGGAAHAAPALPARWGSPTAAPRAALGRRAGGGHHENLLQTVWGHL